MTAVAPFAAHFAERMHQTYIEHDVLEYEEKKRKQGEYLKLVASKERDVLSRTVIVDNVVNLRIQENQHRLKIFLQDRYGPVEELKLISENQQQTSQQQGHHQYHRGRGGRGGGCGRGGRGGGGGSGGGGGIFPSARVRFMYTADAEKVFNRTPLEKVQSVQKIHTRKVGIQKGQDCFIRVMPSRRLDNIAEICGQILEFPVCGLEFGHWVPSHQDIYQSMCTSYSKDQEFDDNHRPIEEWFPGKKVKSFSFNSDPRSLCAKAASGYNLTMKIDFKARTVEISARQPRTVRVGDRRTCKFEDNDSDTSSRDLLIFRFKELVHHMELCRDVTDPFRDRYFLIFSLKLPPRLYREAPQQPSPDGATNGGTNNNNISRKHNSQRERCVDFAGIQGSEAFGQSLGFRIEVDEPTTVRVLLEDNLQRLQDFGIFPPHDKLKTEDDVLSVKSKEFENELEEYEENQRFQYALKAMHKEDSEIGLMLRALLDNVKCSWYHMVRDQARTGGTRGYEVNIFGYLRDISLKDRATNRMKQRLALQVLDKMLTMPGSTKFPGKLFVYLERGLSSSYETTTTTKKEDAPRPLENIPDYCEAIPRLLITPCKTSVLGVGVEMKNRVIRKFVTEEGFNRSSFLRVQVGEETGEKLFDDDVSEAIEHRIKDVVMNGVELNGKLYKFLAYSSSQLKECSFWMVFPEHSWTVEKMRKCLGKFEKDKCPTASYYAARIGQCFSTTIEGQPLMSDDDPSEHRKPVIIEDIVGVNGHSDKIHSDGTGLICRSLMSDLIDGLPFAPANPDDVSIIQIRFGGAKGTLTAWDIDKVRKELLKTRVDVSPNYLPRGEAIILRKSMVKFDAPFASIEVCSIGSSVPYYLNRNVIMLLCYHNVNEEIFIKMQKEMLDDFDNMIIEREVALRVLPRLSGPDSQIRAILLHMLDSGLNPSSEAFLFSCLNAIRSYHLFSLRKKARILVDEGAVLVGGIDETGLVPEGCVFVQISEIEKDPRISRTHRVIKGAVLVTKHPVMHPGDPRMLLAVDIPQLRNQKNIILFSQHGSRSEANKMSGSDLDGDEYAVTWDKKLLLKKFNRCSENERLNATIEQCAMANHTPMDFTPPKDLTMKPLPEKDQQRTRALLDHFINHMKACNLGRISMLWQDYASYYGAGCDQCLELAKLHSIAVDFSKSGIPAVVPSYLRNLDFQRAHWREVKGAPNPRKCPSIIGKLYDDVINRVKGDTEGVKDEISEKVMKGMAGRRTDQYGLVLSSLHKLSKTDPFDDEIPSRLGFGDYDELTATCDQLMEIANSNRSLYNNEILTVMNKYHVRTEGELHTGCIRKFHKMHKKRQHDVSKEVGRWVRNTRNYHRSDFFLHVLNIARERCDLEALEGSPENVLDDQSEHSTDDDLIKVVEKCSTTVETKCLSPWDRFVRKTSFRLAAAYYISTYSPEFRLDASSALFGFPWVVSDVISAGLREKPSSRTPSTESREGLGSAAKKPEKKQVNGIDGQNNGQFQQVKKGKQKRNGHARRQQ